MQEDRQPQRSKAYQMIVQKLSQQTTTTQADEENQNQLYQLPNPTFKNGLDLSHQLMNASTQEKTEHDFVGASDATNQQASQYGDQLRRI